LTGFAIEALPIRSISSCVDRHSCANYFTGL
jgi:hypothetical protein